MKAFRKYYLVTDDPKDLFKCENAAYAFSTFDNDGIIVTNYKYNDLGPQYNPVSIIQYALANYNSYVETQNKENFDTFLKHCKWLMNNFVDKGKWGVWYYNFDFRTPGYNCLRPWVSAMAQGQGISALIRLDSLTTNQNSLEIAKKALATYSISMLEGGVLRQEENGLRWYEEFPCAKMGTVLNGFIFALIGAKEWHDYTGDIDGLEKFNVGIETLKQNIEKFELALPLMKWTRYDNKFIVHSGDSYHDLHIKQLKMLHELTGDPVLYNYYEKWKSWQETYGKSLLYKPYQILCKAYMTAISKLFRRR